MQSSAYSENDDGSFSSSSSFHTSMSLPQGIMSDEVIQQKIKEVITQDTLTDSQGEILKVPPIQYMGNTYAEFKENKALSFLLLSVHPFFNGKFHVDDIRSVNNSTAQRAQSVSATKILSILGIYLGNAILVRKSPIVGLTHDIGMVSMLLKYYFAPKILTELADNHVFYPRLQQQAAQVMQKYEFEQEIQSNPLCEKAYNDFMFYYKNSMNLKRNQQGNTANNQQMSVNNQQEK